MLHRGHICTVVCTAYFGPLSPPRPSKSTYLRAVPSLTLLFSPVVAVLFPLPSDTASSLIARSRRQAWSRYPFAYTPPPPPPPSLSLPRAEESGGVLQIRGMAEGSGWQLTPCVLARVQIFSSVPKEGMS